MKRPSGGMAATHTASRADIVAWIATRPSKARDDAVAMPHQATLRADEGRSAGDQDDVPATAEPYARSRDLISCGSGHVRDLR
jgi:hypothetical protein